MFLGIAAIYFLLFCVFAWKNFRLAALLFIVMLPSYLIRGEIGPFPTTLLELSFGALFLVWLIKYAKGDGEEIKKVMREHKFLFGAIGLFMIASVVSIFVSDMVVASLGQWRAYFLEPMVLFLILVGRRKEIALRHLIVALGISTLSVSVLAIIQQFTGWEIATAEWANPATRRVTSFFSSPNAVGLYLGPIIPLLLITVIPAKAGIQTVLTSGRTAWLPAFAGMTGRAIISIPFTRSEGAWVALGVGVVLFAYLIGYKKMAVATVIAGIVIALVVPQIRTALLFQDKAGQNRLRLWSYSWNYLTESPKNFFLGAGIRQFFRKVQKPRYNPKEMERLIYPHSIFLNFWTEIGLFGALSFSAIMGYLVYLANKIRTREPVLGAALLASLAVIIVHGLVDVPYFKNDLATMFWIIATLVIASINHPHSGYHNFTF